MKWGANFPTTEHAAACVYLVQFRAAPHSLRAHIST